MNAPLSAWMQQGLRHRAEGRLDLALQTFREVLARQPDLPRVWYALADVQEDLGLTADAADSYLRAAALQPAMAEAHYSRARMLRLLGQREPAEAAVQRGLAQTDLPVPLQAQMLQLLSLLQDEAGDLAGALSTLDRAIGVQPSRPALHHNRGVLLQRLNRPIDALAAVERALHLGLSSADAHYNRGNSLQSLGRLPEAMAAYRQALAVDGLHGLALYDLARLRWRLGDPDFLQELVAACRAAPAAAGPWAIQGRLLLRAENHAASAEAYRQAIARAPDVSGYQDGLAQCLSRLGHTEAALAAHQRAIDLAPQQAGARITYAGSLLQAGRLEAASAQAAVALELDPLDQQAWAFQGLAWRALADPRAHWLHDVATQIRSQDLPAPPGWPDIGAFNAALAECLEALHVDARAPIDQTLRSGTQTLGNLLDRDQPLIQQLRGQLASAIDAYVAHLAALPEDAHHPLLGRRSLRWRFSDSWSSRLGSGGFHTNHVHSHGWISACYYVALPPVMRQAPADAVDQAGWIAFGEPDLQIPACPMKAEHAVRPVVGRLVLFPSSMWHGTVPFTDTATRLTVAFDVLPLD